MPKDERIFIGVDLGGTKILAVAFDSKLRVLATEKAKTPREANGKTTSDSMRKSSISVRAARSRSSR